mgnify:CR=1 FL=1
MFTHAGLELIAVEYALEGKIDLQKRNCLIVEVGSGSTEMIIMNQGVIEQIGKPSEVYHHPASLFVADFMGSPTVKAVIFPPDNALQAAGIGRVERRQVRRRFRRRGHARQRAEGGARSGDREGRLPAPAERHRRQREGQIGRAHV